MRALRFLALVALGLWLGSLVTLGTVVAPVLFRVLPAHDPTGGRSLAGLAFGAVLESDAHACLLLGAFIALTLAWRARRGPRPRDLVWRSLLLAAMVGATVATGEVLGPRIDAIRVGTAGDIGDLPESDPVKITFERLHALSGGLMLGTIGGGLILLWREMRDP